STKPIQNPVPKNSYGVGMSTLGPFDRCTHDLRANNREWGPEIVAGQLAKSCPLQFDPRLAIRMASISHSFPNWGHPVLEPTQPGSGRRGYVLNKDELSARLQNSQYFFSFETQAPLVSCQACGGMYALGGRHPRSLHCVQPALPCVHLSNRSMRVAVEAREYKCAMVRRRIP